MAAVEAIDGQADDEPREESQPCEDRQAGHQQYAEKYAKHRGCYTAGRAEAATAIRLAIAKNDYADRYEHKSKQRADVRQVGERSNVEESRWQADQESGNPRCGGRSTKARMNATECGWQVTVHSGNEG